MQSKFLRGIFTLLIGTIGANSFGQAPQQFNYQAVIRDDHGQPLVNKSVQLRLRIRNGGANGAANYTEVRTVNTNEFGLVAVAVNSPGADLQQGSMGLVDWANGAKFLQVEVDHDKDGTFTDMGATQILSAPYAMFAAPTGNAAGDLAGKYPNPTVSGIQGKPVDMSGNLYHGYTLKWDQVNNKWVPGKDEDGGPDFYFKATKNPYEATTYIGMDPQFFWGFVKPGSMSWKWPFVNTLRFPSEEADPYGLFKDSIFTTPTDGYYEFEVNLWFQEFHFPASRSPIGFLLLGVLKNDTTKLTFTLQHYETEEDGHDKPIRLKRTLYLQQGDRLKFIFAHNDLKPVILSYSPGGFNDYEQHYHHVNRECLTISGRRLR